MSGTAPMSDAVMTARTPGRARAAGASIPRMRPWAKELRSTTACSMPSTARSPTYSPRPRRKRRSSIRSIGLPTSRLVVRACSITGSFRVETDAGELPLRQFLHGVAHALAPEPARTDAAERIGVEPEAARLVDPQRARLQLARHLERGVEARGEAGRLQAEFGRVGERERGRQIGDRLHYHDRAERLFAHQPGVARSAGDDRRAEDAV